MSSKNTPSLQTPLDLLKALRTGTEEEFGQSEVSESFDPAIRKIDDSLMVAARAADLIDPAASFGGQLGAAVSAHAKAGAMGNLTSGLAALHSEFQNHMSEPGAHAGPTAQNFKPASSTLTVGNGYVVVNVVAVDGDGAGLYASLQALGLQGGDSFGAIASGLLPIAELESLSVLENVNFATAARAISRAGLTQNQGDFAIQGDVARADYGVDGSGVSIGILSDSFNNLNSYAADVTSGDLPAGINILDDFTTGGSDEGRAMAQIAYDIAPGADFLFHTAFDGVASFAQGINDLQVAGADIIVDDVAYFAEPFFQDGALAQAVDQVTASGAVYLSASGNDGRNSYESAFRDSGTRVDLDGNGSLESLAHDFDPGAGVDIYQDFTLFPGETITISFQWDQPFASAGGAGSATDMDIFLYTAAGVEVAFSNDDNIDGDAVEFIEYTNNGASTLGYRLLIAHFEESGGPVPAAMKYIDFSGGTSDAEYHTNSGTIYGQAGAASAIAVGAAFYQETPEYGFDPALLESYSSQGDVTIYFDGDGNRLATPEVRLKPEFVAVDGGNTSFFGDEDTEGDGFLNFFGTSASAPLAAGAAALLLQADGTLTPSEVEAAFTLTAFDMDVAGIDDNTGAGLIYTDSALSNVLFGSTHGDDILVGTSASDTILGLEGNDTLTGDAAADILIGGSGADTLDGGTGADTMTGGDGDDSYFVDNTGDLIIELAAGGTADVVRSTATYTLSDNIEQLRLLGSANIDATGNTGDNLLVGNSGNNRLDGAAGADTLQGADGDDIYFIDNAGDVVIEGSNLGTDQIQSFISITLASNIENGLLLTTANLDLTGNAFGNTLFGNAGNNILDGGAGVDVMAGGAGDDTYIVDLPSDFVSEQAAAGTDLAQSTVNYSLRPNIENLTLLGTANLQGIGNAENNILIGNSGANRLNGSLGADTMTGGDGNDIYSVDDAGDVVTENANEGVDTILSFATQTLGANVERLYLFGSADIDATGNGENNGLLGNDGSNVLSGEAGNDLLFGGLGNDTMTGGSGFDTFFFHTALDGVNNVETLIDFTHADDTMRLDSAVFTGLSTGLLSSNAFIIGTAAGDADDRIIYDETTGDLFFDVDGAGAAAQVLFATLDDMPTDIVANDFLVF